jgi:hypothetical protein
VRRFVLLAVAVLPLAAATAACDDGLGLGEPTIASDSSAIIGVPSDGTLPTAIDFSQVGFPGMLRRPELLTDATQWDYALRREGEGLKLIPNEFDIPTRRPLILRSSDAFEAIDRAPTARSAYGDSAMVLQEGAVYVVRTRQYQVPGGFCYAYAKARVVDLNTVAGTAEFSLKGNIGCADDRLEFD